MRAVPHARGTGEPRVDSRSAPRPIRSREPSSPNDPRHAAVLRLQRLAGNAAVVQRIIFDDDTGTVYEKLHAHDWYDQRRDAGRTVLEQLSGHQRRYKLSTAIARAKAADQAPPPRRGRGGGEGDGEGDDRGSRKRRIHERQDAVAPRAGRAQTKRARTITATSAPQKDDEEEEEEEASSSGDDHDEEEEGEGEPHAFPPALFRPWEALDDEHSYFLPKPTPQGQSLQSVAEGSPCWKWALTGVEGTGPNVDILFAWLNGGAGADGLEQLEAGMRRKLRTALKAIRNDIFRANLALTLQDFRSDARVGAVTQARARNKGLVVRLVKRAMVVALEAHDFVVVADGASNAAVVGQFKPASGVTVDHWWLEVDGIRLQTVSGQTDVQIGTYMTEQAGLDAGTTVNVPVWVQGPKRSHVDFVVHAMAHPLLHEDTRADDRRARERANRGRGQGARQRKRR